MNLILLVVALVLFILAAINVGHPRVVSGWAGSRLLHRQYVGRAWHMSDLPTLFGGL